MRKHQNWLWAIIIVGTIVSFVWFFNPSSRYGGGGGGDTRSGDTGATIQGRPISIQELADASRAAEILYFFQHGEWAPASQMGSPQSPINNLAYQQIAINTKAKELGIQPTPKAIAQKTEEFLMRLGVKREEISPAVLNNVEQQFLAPHHLNLEDWSRFAATQVAVDQMISLFGMSGKLITPKEAEAFWVRENEPMVAQVAYFPLSNYMSQVNIPLKDAESYFTTNRAAYRLPERVQVQYVTFPMSNYTAAAEKELTGNTNFTQEIQALYERNGADKFTDENGKPLSADAAKAKLKKEIVDRTADRMARTNAIALVEDLNKGHDDNNPFSIDDLQKIAQAHNAQVKVTEPFDMRTGPKEFKPSQMFMRAAFSLSTNAPEDKSRSMIYAQAPVQYEDGWMVIGLKQHIASQDQTFAQAQTKVVDDMKEAKAFQMAAAAGQAFYAKAASATAQGKSFDSVAAADKVTAVTLPPFSLNSATNLQSAAQVKQMEKTDPNVAFVLGNHREFQQLVEDVFSLQPGKVASYVPSMRGGYVVYMKSRLPVDQAKLQKELPDYLGRLREQRASAAFSEWFQKQAQEMRLVVPQQQQPMS